MPYAAIFALAGLALTVFLQAMIGGFFIGRLSQRVKSVEDNGAGHSGMAMQFAEFRGAVTAQLTGQTLAMEGLRKDLTWLRQTAVYEPEQMRDAFRPKGER